MSKWTKEQKVEQGALDKEWVELLLLAKKEGLTVDEIRRFLAQAKTQPK
ncbi:hypothetical protein DCC39_09390 [Pueribacillus theae]|uniref:Sin domain-containing protein n=1 Tax=Pueribacillus theae TaxID=2171751 RepID=A0A2U1K112_9BACI|nr:anti-repressor SinI family protein [Pueribacillus theae]PWA11177.1 hypothetical protein DCC39_09390 [Pueribacillus theae]